MIDCMRATVSHAVASAIWIRRTHTDVCPSRFDQMIDLRHPLAVLAQRVP